MNDPALPHGLGRWLRYCTSQRRERAAEILVAKIPRNPLKSLDSDERIQGNPRKSNSGKWVFSQRKGDKPRKPKRLGRGRALKGEVPWCNGRRLT
jgi:hypothetical protein